LLYAPARFALDFLRTGDRTYLGLTPAQWLCFVLVGIAVSFIVKRQQLEAIHGVELLGEGDGDGELIGESDTADDELRRRR